MSRILHYATSTLSILQYSTITCSAMNSILQQHAHYLTIICYGVLSIVKCSLAECSEYAIFYNSMLSKLIILQQQAQYLQYHTTAGSVSTISYNSRLSIYSIIQQQAQYLEYPTTASSVFHSTP